MKTAALVALNLAVTVAAVVGAHLLLGPGAPPPAPPERREAPSPDAALADRLRKAEARVDELAAAVDGLRRDLEASRKQAADAQAALAESVEKERQRAAAAESLLATAAVDSPKRTGEMDAFAKEVSRAMKKGIGQEFRRIADLVTSPSPEALDQRRRQLKMFAAMLGTQAGLDQAQIATFEGILNETDERAREDLRPLLQGVEDYRKVDYAKVRKVTDDSFAAQNARIDQELPKDKSDRLKQQIEPIRSVFGAMIDELERQSAAPAEPK